MLALALAGCGAHHEPRLTVGAVEDAAKFSSDPAAKLRLAHDAGYGADVLSARWTPDATAETDAIPLRAAVKAAVAAHVEPVLAVYQLSSSTPRTPAERASFAAYATALAAALPDVRRVLVGNEPNLNLFWQPQYAADGSDAAAADYASLLAVTYDALKREDPSLIVIGGSLSPHGSDDPAAARQTHSPTRFIADVAAALKAHGRTKPVMDAFSLHVYGESARVPPTLRHPRTSSLGIADYARLVELLDSSFGGQLPIVYGEYGVETRIPEAKAAAYTGSEVVTVVDEATQARYYREAIALAACQPRVEALYLFHVSDEQPLAGLQSGLFYADDTPKSSLEAVRDSLQHPRCVKVTSG